MSAKIAIFVDTCVVSTSLIPLGLMQNPNMRVLIDENIQNELNVHIEHNRRLELASQARISTKRQKLDLILADSNFVEAQAAREIVKPYQKEGANVHEEQAFMLLYRALKSGLQINFENSPRNLCNFFRGFETTYASVLSLLDLEVRLDNYKIGIHKKPTQMTRAQVREYGERLTISSLERFKSEFEPISQMQKDINTTQNAHTRDFTPYQNCVRTLLAIRFAENILPATSDPVVTRLAKYTPKSLAARLFSENERKPFQSLRMTQYLDTAITYFAELVDDFECNTFSFGSIKKGIVEDLRTKIKYMIEQRNGYPDIKKVDTDADFIATSRRYVMDTPQHGCEQIYVCSMDCDVLHLMKLTDSLYRIKNVSPMPRYRFLAPAELIKFTK